MAYLYPPIIDDTVTAYEISPGQTDGMLVIPFYLQNPLDDIDDYILVRITDAYDNCLLSNVPYCSPWEIQSTDEEESAFYLAGADLENRYCVEIPMNQLNLSASTGAYFHVQLKIIAKNITTKPALVKDWEAWINNADNTSFERQSSWSEVSIRNFVNVPDLIIAQRTNNQWLQISEKTAEGHRLDFKPEEDVILRVTFKYTDLLETDAIEWCRFHVQEQVDGSECFTSERIYPSSQNVFKVTIPYSHVNQAGRLYYTFKTKKGLIKIVSENEGFSFDNTNASTTAFPESWAPVLSIQNNHIVRVTLSQIALHFEETAPSWLESFNHLVLHLQRRLPGAGVWERIAERSMQGLDYADAFIEDATAVLGVPYEYGIYLSSSASNIFDTTAVQSLTPYVTVCNENILLATKQQTLTIRFNPELTGLKRNFKDTVTSTLGNGYPFIYRSQHQKYRTFTLGGMISQEANSEWSAPAWTAHLTCSETDRDIITERIFRDEVLNFIESGKVFLFKSLQEGNMFVHLSNISLKSEKALGRMIYSFSATVTEVCEFNADNCLKYFSYDDAVEVIQERRTYATGTVDNANTTLNTSSDFIQEQSGLVTWRLQQEILSE